MGWNPYQSLRSFASSQPPLLMFTVCLMAFGLTMAILAYIIGVNEVPNPDVVDWNKFLGKLTDVDMCTPKNHLREVNTKEHVQAEPEPGQKHTSANVTYNATVSRLVHSNSMSAVVSRIVGSVASENVKEDSVVSVSVKVHVTVTGTSDVVNSLPSVLQGSLPVSELETGRKSPLLLNMTLNFLPTLNVSCDGVCHVVRELCLTIQTPSSLLPHTKSPEKCKQNPPTDITDVDLFSPSMNSASCANKELIHLQYIPDPHLTEMLSLTERSIVNLHLMHTSYFMFVMVTTLLCYALIKGRYPQAKVVMMEKVPLDP